MCEEPEAERERRARGTSVNLTKFIRVNWKNDSKRRGRFARSIHYILNCKMNHRAKSTL